MVTFLFVLRACLPKGKDSTILRVLSKSIISPNDMITASDSSRFVSRPRNCQSPFSSCIIRIISELSYITNLVVITY